MILFTAIDPANHAIIIGRGTDERQAADDLLAAMADYAARNPSATVSDAWRINFETPANENWS